MPTRPWIWKLLIVAIATTGCGGAAFQSAPGAMVYKPLPRTTRILVAAQLDQLPQPNAVLGDISLPPAKAAGPKDKAIGGLVTQAHKFGCDALAEVTFARRIIKTVRRQRYTTKSRKVAYRNVVYKRPVTQWTARCVRTNVVGFAGGRPAPEAAPAPATAVAAAPAPAAAAAGPAPRADRSKPATVQTAKPVAKARPTAADRRREKAERAAQRKQAAEAERARQAEAARAQAAAKETERQRAEQEAAKQKAREEELAKAAAEAARHREAAEAAERERQRKIAEEAARITGRKNYEADAAKANASADPAVQVAFIVRWPTRPESADVLSALQLTAPKKSAAWVTSKLRSTETSKGPRPPEMDEARLAGELKKAGAKDARFVFTRSETWKHEVRNPTSAPVLFEIEANGAKLRTVVAAGKTASVMQRVACGAGGPITRKRARGVLELRFACPSRQAATIIAMVPVDREVAIARDGLGDSADLAAMGKVLAALPGTRAVHLALNSVDAILAGRRGTLSGVSGTTKIVDKDPDAGMIDVAVNLRNRSATDVTVVFDVGVGRLTRIPVLRKADETITLPMAASITPKLLIKDVLPRMRTADWLVGRWRAGDAELLILPGEEEGYVAFAIGPRGDGNLIRVLPLTLTIEGAHVIVSGKVPVAFTREGLPDEVRQKCARGCAARLTTPLTSLGKFEVGGPREMALMLEAGGGKASVTFLSKF